MRVEPRPTSEREQRARGVDLAPPPGASRRELGDEQRPGGHASTAAWSDGLLRTCLVCHGGFPAPHAVGWGNQGRPGSSTRPGLRCITHHGVHEDCPGPCGFFVLPPCVTAAGGGSLPWKAGGPGTGFGLGLIGQNSRTKAATNSPDKRYLRYLQPM